MTDAAQAEGVVPYQIVEVDYFERDATLVIGGERLYFQFRDEPTLARALAYIAQELRSYKVVR